jgi:DNA-binding NarL/FixJ family response regulator
MVSSPEKQISVLVVSLPGFMQNMLRETFNHRFDVIGVASGGLSAVGMIQQKQPDLVVIDSSLPVSETRALISWMKEECRQTCSLVLAENSKQLKEANRAGADMTLRSYSLPEGLDRVLGHMRSNHNNK